MDAILTITEPNGRSWQTIVNPGVTYTIGRAKDNDIVLNDRRVSRKHAFISSDASNFWITDGYIENGELLRSINHVFVNGDLQLECLLNETDTITIGESTLEFKFIDEDSVYSIEEHQPADTVVISEVKPATIKEVESSQQINYDDSPLGHTQVAVSVNELIGRRSNLSLAARA